MVSQVRSCASFRCADPRPTLPGQNTWSESELLLVPLSQSCQRAAAALALLACGCNALEDGALEPASVPAPGGSFANAAEILPDAEGRVAVSGPLTAGQVHVFDLGPLEVGDLVSITVRSAGDGRLIPVAGLFDSSGFLLVRTRRLATASQYVLRETTEHGYLAITPAYRSSHDGDYEAVVLISRGAGLASGSSVQAVVLNFDGGQVSFPDTGSVVLKPFDAADVDPAYDGSTVAIRDRIIATVQQNFQGTGLLIITRADPALTWSTVHFGGFDPASLGRAENLDRQNTDIGDDGIVFTDRFADAFWPLPSADEIATAIGNVASHEIGHLVGLEHVSDPVAIMDASSPVEVLLGRQEFTIAPLDRTIFPIGRQDAPTLLRQAVCPVGLICQGGS